MSLNNTVRSAVSFLLETKANDLDNVSASVHAQMGLLYIGIVIATALWGFGTVQLYYYFDRFPKDKWQLKLLVTTVYVLDTAHQGLVTSSGYAYLITHYGDRSYLNVIHPGIIYMVLISAFVCILVQGFLTLRIWRLSASYPFVRRDTMNAGNISLCAFIALCSVSIFALTVIYFYKANKIDTYAELPKIAWLSQFINGLAAATDVFISLVLIFLLNRTRTGLRRTETMINRLIIFTVNTGAVTSIAAVFTAIFVSLYPNAMFFVMTYLWISRLYTNTLYATLNHRKVAAIGLVEDHDGEVISFQSMGRFARNTRNTRDPPFAITIETETTRAADESYSGPKTLEPITSSDGDSKQADAMKANYLPP